MSTPKDQQRITAFRRWYGQVAVNVENASAILGIGARTVQRFIAGKQVPPVRLLEELARTEPDQALAQQLRGAADPAETPDA